MLAPLVMQVVSVQTEIKMFDDKRFDKYEYENIPMFTKTREPKYLKLLDIVYKDTIWKEGAGLASGRFLHSKTF